MNDDVRYVCLWYSPWQLQLCCLRSVPSEEKTRGRIETTPFCSKSRTISPDAGWNGRMRTNRNLFPTKKALIWTLFSERSPCISTCNLIMSWLYPFHFRHTSICILVSCMGHWKRTMESTTVSLVRGALSLLQAFTMNFQHIMCLLVPQCF